MAKAPKEAKEKPKHPGGRPTIYCKELADKICDAVATSTDGIRKMCNNNPGFPNADTIYQWRYKYPEFSDQYAKAKIHQADLLAQEIVEIADDNSGDEIETENGRKMNFEFVARSRLRMDARRWLASKLIPKVYGDKTQTETILRISHEEALEALK